MDNRIRASEPADVDRLFMEAWNCNDLDGIVALFEPDGVLIPQAGERVTGRDAIRQVFAGFSRSCTRISFCAGPGKTVNPRPWRGVRPRSCGGSPVASGCT